MSFQFVCTSFSSSFLDLFSWCDPTFCCLYQFQCFSLLNCFCRGSQMHSNLPSCHKSEPSEPYIYCHSSAWPDSPHNLAFISLVLLSITVLSCLFFFPHSWPSFVFSESTQVSWILCFSPTTFLLLIDSMITPFTTYISSKSPEPSLSPHFDIGYSISTTQGKRESLPGLQLQNHLDYNKICHLPIGYSHCWVLRKEKNRKSFLNEFFDIILWELILKEIQSSMKWWCLLDRSWKLEKIWQNFIIYFPINMIFQFRNEYHEKNIRL